MNTSSQSELVIQFDFDRAISARFAPHEKRRGLALVSLLDHELAKIHHQTSDPLLRRIKSQFWREALADPDGNGHALAKQLNHCFASLNDMMALIEHLLEIHEKYHEVVLSPALERKRNIERQGTLFKLAYCYLNNSGKAQSSSFFERGALVYGGLFHLYKGQRGAAQLPEKANEDLELIKKTYEGLLGDLATIDPLVRSAVLPLALVPSYLNLFQSSDRMAETCVDLHPAKKVWILWRAARKGF